MGKRAERTLSQRDGAAGERGSCKRRNESSTKRRKRGSALAHQGKVAIAGSDGERQRENPQAPVKSLKIVSVKGPSIHKGVPQQQIKKGAENKIHESRIVM